MKIVEVLEDGIQRLNRVGHRRHKLPRYSSSKITNTLYDQTFSINILYPMKNVSFKNRNQ